MILESHYLHGAVLLAMLASSAFFSAVRAAYFSITEADFKLLQAKENKQSKRVEGLLIRPGELFTALQIGKYGALFGLLYFVALGSRDLSSVFATTYELTYLAGVIAVLMALFLITEVWAKIFVMRHYLTVIELTAFWLTCYFRLVSPIVKPLVAMLESLAGRLEVNRYDAIFANDKFMTIMEEGEQVSGLADDEREMIHSIYVFGETEVHEIMTPRTDIVSVEENTDMEGAAKLMKQKGHSRLPLYKEDIDNILGIIHVKDILPQIGNEKGETPCLAEIARPAYFVPVSKKLGEVLREFQMEKHHMAIVVDEYGGTAGLVTLEDVIEEIVGDIQDEYDQEPPLFKRIDEHTYSVDAKIDLHELNEELQLDLPTEGEYESLGGFILTLTGYVPEPMELVTYNGYQFKIERVVRNRIIRVQIKKEMDLTSSEENKSKRVEDNHG